MININILHDYNNIDQCHKFKRFYDPLLFFKKELEKIGYNIAINSVGDITFVMVHEFNNYKDYYNNTNPLFVFDYSSSVSQNNISTILDIQNAKYFKPTVFKEKKLYTLDSDNRYHLDILNNKYKHYYDESNSVGNNISLCWNHGFSAGTFKSINLDDNVFFNKKTYDIHCSFLKVGYVKGDKYNIDTEFTKHRVHCFNTIQTICKRLNLSYIYGVYNDEYINTLRESKICISPWGIGELCWRDFEAISNGCVLIKPDTSFIDTHISLENGYVPVYNDFRNLEETISMILNNYDFYINKTYEYYKYFINTFFEFPLYFNGIINNI